jgi:hypothetical protein
MAQFNPYAAPTDDGGAARRVTLDDDATTDSEVIELLKQTRPWVQMLGVLGYMVAAVMGIGGALVVAFGSKSGGDFPWWLGIIWVVTAAAYVFPCMALLRYGRSIGDLANGQGTPALVDALRHQKSFWRYTGLVTIAFLVLFSLGISAISNYINIMNISRM